MSDSRECVIRMRNCHSNGRFYILMADFTMGNGTFYRNGVNFGECDVLTTHSREFDVLTTHSLTSHFIGETSAAPPFTYSCPSVCCLPVNNSGGICEIKPI